MQNGFIYLLKTFDDVSPIQINTELYGSLCIEWSNSRELLAVAGSNLDNKSSVNQQEYINILKFYNEKGSLLYSVKIPFAQVSNYEYDSYINYWCVISKSFRLRYLL